MLTPTQRSSSRRAVLAGLGSAAALASGCVSPLGSVGSDAVRETVSVLAAGSLQGALSEGFGDVEHEVQVEARGSVAVARLVATGKRDPDVVALADVDLFDSILDAPWYATVATNALVVAYDADSEGGRRVEAADRWFDPVLSGETTLGRTDPDLDPLGYRTLFMLSLAAAYYDRPDLRRRLLDERQIYPETSLLSRLATGDLDAAVVYRTMAAERDFAFCELPAAVDLGDSDRVDTYADASYTLADGERVTGNVIRYGARGRNDREATRAVFERIAGGDLLADQGFAVGDQFPTYRGELPRVYRP